MKTTNAPIETLYTDSEIVKIHKKLVKKWDLSVEDLALLKEINEYMNRPA